MTGDKNDKVTKTPYFSIGITAYNREKFIKRCIMSCLEQDFNDFEIVVIDDGSTDRTVQAIKSIRSPCIRLVIHSENMGQADAKNDAIAYSRGRWLISLDSDWEMLPGALNSLFERTQSVPEDIGVIGSSVAYEDGSISPRFVPDSIMNYESRIIWTEAEGGTDYLRCVRREVYNSVHWPCGKRGAVTFLFALDLAKATKQSISRQVIVKQYMSDSSVQRVKGFAGVKNLLRNARGIALVFDEYFRRHGETLSRLAPNLLYKGWIGAAKQNFLCGKRKAGISYIAKCLRATPFSLRIWSIFLFGSISKNLLAFAIIYLRSILSNKRPKTQKESKLTFTLF